MIINGFLYFAYGFLSLLLAPISGLADVVLNPNIHSSLLTARTYLANLNLVLPVGTILAVFGLIIAIEGFILIYKVVNWLIRKIPTIN